MKHYKSNTTFVHEIAIIFSPIYSSEATSVITVAHLIHSHKKRIVWKHGPNRPFYALMLRTKLYQNPFFFTGDQNVNKPKSRTARSVYEPIFLPFYKIIVSFFFFFLSRYKQSEIELWYNRLQLSKKHKLTLYKTLNGEPAKLRRS